MPKSDRRNDDASIRARVGNMRFTEYAVKKRIPEAPGFWFWWTGKGTRWTSDETEAFLYAERVDAEECAKRNGISAKVVEYESKA